MNAMIVRRTEMKYRDSDIHYDSDMENLEAEVVRDSADGKQYRRKRSIQATRKRASRSAASNPGCGIGARRQRRWTW
jgi:hypothetical protein